MALLLPVLTNARRLNPADLGRVIIINPGDPGWGTGPRSGLSWWSGGYSQASQADMEVMRGKAFDVVLCDAANSSWGDIESWGTAGDIASWFSTDKATRPIINLPLFPRNGPSPLANGKTFWQDIAQNT